MKSRLSAGMQIGALTLISSFRKDFPRGGRHTMWICRCKCSSLCEKPSSSLLRLPKHKTPSCGCEDSKAIEQKPKHPRQRRIMDEGEEVYLRRRDEIKASWTPEQREARWQGERSPVYQIPIVKAGGLLDKTGEFQ